MSTLFSSFIYEPVVRQARRWSGPEALQNGEGDRLSHANEDDRHTTAQQDDGGSLGTAGEALTGDAITEEDPDRLRGDSGPVLDASREDSGETNILLSPTATFTSTHDLHDSTTTPLAVEDANVISSSITHVPGVDAATLPPLHLPTPTMAPRTHLSPSSARVSSARNIPRAQMSLRSDSPSVCGSLPDDDGMAPLRQKIHGIREEAASQEEKARRMHELMTEEWHAAQIAIRPQSPASMTSQERLAPASPVSTGTGPAMASPSSTAELYPVVSVDPKNPFNIHPEDLQPSYRPLPDPVEVAHDSESPEENASDPLEPVLGCSHYKRNVKIQCFDCKEWHACRHCHDAEVTTHLLNRRKTENMLCMLCWTPQAAAQYCKECGENAAWYYCDICKLWDDDGSKRIYHCAECGICRRGEGLGKDYVHCKKCNVCISISHYPTHTCIENATDSNCPLCLDYMFTSPLEIVAMPCGHYLHHHCYTSLMTTTYQCPICKRSAVNMETQWHKLDEQIRHQPMPREWAGVRVEARCNDCGGLSIAPYHWLGLKCGRCDGFNTVQVRLLAGEEVARDVQDFAEQRRERMAAERGMGREPEIRRTFTAPVTVRPYFMDDEEPPRPSSARSGDAFVFPELPRMPDFPDLNGFIGRDRLPNMPSMGMPNMPNMPTMNMPSMGMPRVGMPSMPQGFNPFEMLGRVGRSLSPIRHYFDDQIAEGVPRQWRHGMERAEGEVDEGWREHEGWFGRSTDEDDDERGRMGIVGVGVRRRVRMMRKGRRSMARRTMMNLRGVGWGRDWI